MIGFFVGLWIGVMIGIVTASLVVMARDKKFLEQTKLNVGNSRPNYQ